MEVELPVPETVNDVIADSTATATRWTSSSHEIDSYPTSNSYHNNNNNNNTVTKADVFENNKRPDDDVAMTSSVKGVVDDEIPDDCEPLIIDVRSPGSIANNSSGSNVDMVDGSPMTNDVSPQSNMSDEDMRITPTRSSSASSSLMMSSSDHGQAMLLASPSSSMTSSIARQHFNSQYRSMASTRCPPVREAVDPAKYITISGEPDGVKYACSKCGNVYKWRKSLNKHWKEKHDGEVPDPPGSASPAIRLAAVQQHNSHPLPHHSSYNGSGVQKQNGFTSRTGHSTSWSSQFGNHNQSSAAGEHPSPSFLKVPMKGSLASLNPALFNNFRLNPSHRGSTTKSVGAIAGLQHTAPISLLNDESLRWPTPESLLKIPRYGTALELPPVSDEVVSFMSPGKNGIVACPEMAHQGRVGQGPDKPVDLTLSLTSPVTLSAREKSHPVEDSEVLDLSSKSTATLSCSPALVTPWPLSAVPMNLISSESGPGNQLPVIQDEPLDFSNKSSVSNGTPSSKMSAAAGSMFAASVATAAQYSQRSQNISPSVSLQTPTSSAVVACSQCYIKFGSYSQLNRHFSRDHMDAFKSASGSSDRQSALVGGAGTGSAQLFRYLTGDVRSTAPKSLVDASGCVSCLVCDRSFSRRWEAANHFDECHVSVSAVNPYREDRQSSGIPDGTAFLSPANGVVIDDKFLQKNLVAPSVKFESPLQSLPTDSPMSKQYRCNLCPYSTDSYSSFAGHRYHHTSQLESIAKTSSVHGSQFGGRPVADELLRCSDDDTAIVIPQAPEDSTAAVTGTPTLPTLPLTKVFSSGASGPKSGRSRKADLLGFVAASGGNGAAAEALLPFKCDLCEYRARWPSEMTQHAKNHSDEKPFHCPQCTYRSKWKWDVVKHLKRCGGGNCTARDVIDTTATSTSGAKTSSSIASCSTQLNRYYEMVNGQVTGGQRRRRPPFHNVRSVLLNASNGSLLDNKENSLASLKMENFESINGVPSGDGSFSNSTAYQQHSITPSPSSIDAVELTKTSPTEAGENDAPVTSVVTTTGTTSVVNGATSPSPAVNQGLHYCAQCPFVGHSPAELRRHLRVHSTEKPYSCRSCSYSSKWKCDLKKHLRTYNHLPAVPLVYGGHGRKPLQSADSSSVSSSLKYDDALARGSFYSSITAGGRLSCRWCQFEAVDITSLLQHNATVHRVQLVPDSSGDVDCAGVDRATDRHQYPPTPEVTSSHHHHRRKSFKQNRVVNVQQLSDGDTATSNSDGESNASVESYRSQEDDNKFWASLGLQCRRLTSPPETAGGKRNAAAAIGNNSTAENGLKSKFVTEASEISAADSCSTSGLDETDLDCMDTDSMQQSDQLVDLSFKSGVKQTQPGTFDVKSCEMTKSPEVDQFSATRRRRWSWTRGIEGFNWRTGLNQQASVDEQNGLWENGGFRRRRKLRTCDKCGYVTDNLTTLQRHVAKHGSAGRHRCSLCTYTVERQHILDYHIKIVHGADAASKVASLNNGVDLSAKGADDDQVGVERATLGGLSGNLSSSTSAAATVANEITWPRVNDAGRRRLCSWRPERPCIQCGYSFESRSAASRHRLVGHSTLVLRCDLCSRKASTASILALHRARVHGQTTTGEATAATASTPAGEPHQSEEHRCSECPYKTNSPAHLAGHVRYHGEPGRSHRCPRCSYSVEQRRLLAQHLRLHQDGRRQRQLERDASLVRCGQCPYRCHSAVQVAVHRRLHRRRRQSSTYRYACRRCSFAVNVRNAFQHHLKLHPRDALEAQ